MPSLTPCPQCGKRSTAKVMCHECRRARNASRSCAQCGTSLRPRQREYCSSACFGKADGERRRAQRIAVTAHARRVDRAASAVGLSDHARRRLLAQWRRQGRACTYCAGQVDTVDHVIPLVRGGTNHEGNLTPACRSCNSRKQDRLVIEFRLGLRASETYTPFRERPKAERVVKVRPARPVLRCPICTSPFEQVGRKACCSKECSREFNGRRIRDAYRIKHGLAVDPSRPTAYWLRITQSEVA